MPANWPAGQGQHRRALQHHRTPADAVRSGARHASARRLRACGLAADRRRRCSCARWPRDALIAFALAAPVAVALAWLTSILVSRRVDAIADVARRYGDGDMSGPPFDYGDGRARRRRPGARRLGAGSSASGCRNCRATARAWKPSCRGWSKACWWSIGRGGVQLVNGAAQQMLRMDGGAAGRPYLEVIRHPDIAAQLAAALRGERIESARARPVARSRPHVRRPSRSRVADRRRRRRAGAARHHRSAPGRPDSARLRRQRVARAAYTAHRDTRLRRGAARGRSD